MINEKSKIISSAYDDLSKAFKGLELSLLKRILSFLKKHRTKRPTKKQLSAINTKLNQLINREVLLPSVSKYLKNFDKVEAISKKILQKGTDLDLKDFNLTDEKKLFIKEIRNGLLNNGVLRHKLRDPISNILYRYATTNISLEDVEDELRRTLPANMERHVRTIARESLSRFDGFINQKVVTEFKLDGFSIVGSLIRTSERQCVEMVRETGKLGAFAVNGKYRISDLPEIVRILKREYPGVYKGLTAENFFIYRNHWGCRHQFIPTRLLERDKKVFEERDSIG